jgi:putative flavoprotein involved in K+ transport
MKVRHDTVIIGAGQAGLAMSYCLRERGREHILLERKRIAERWHTERWRSLHFQSPNWTLRLPGFSYQGDKPDCFAHYREIAKFIEDYARHIEAPVRCGATVVSLEKDAASGNFLIRTEDGEFEAARVVVATGPFQRPAIPGLCASLPHDIFQVHASRYVRDDHLPPGAVLIVGSGGSGSQIAEELYQAGRTVYLCASRHNRMPRRYRGRDLLFWLFAMGRMDVRIDSFPGRKMPPTALMTGVDGGHDLNLRRFAADGVVICGRLRGITDTKLSFGDDAEQIVAGSDNAFLEFKRAADDYIGHANINAPAEADTGPNAFGPPLRPVPSLDLRDRNINSVVWATGYRFEFEWLKLPVFDEMGAPIQERGITHCANLYFLGLHWMHTRKSGLLFGVGDDAAYLADYIDARA